jgi:Protein of unknown function (DUF1236)
MRKILFVTTCSAALSAWAAFAAAPVALAQADQQKHEGQGGERAKTPVQSERKDTSDKPAQMNEQRAAEDSNKTQERKNAEETKKPNANEQRSADEAKKPDEKSTEKSADDVKKPDAMSKEKAHAEEGTKPDANAAKERRANEQSAPKNETGQAQERRSNERASQNGQDKRKNGATAADGGKAHHDFDPRQASDFRERVQREGHVNVTNVDFDVRVGVGVPADVALVALPTDLVEEYPEYRGYDVVLVQDEVVIVDPESRDVVDVVGGPPTTRAAAVNPCATND